MGRDILRVWEAGEQGKWGAGEVRKPYARTLEICK